MSIKIIKKIIAEIKKWEGWAKESANKYEQESDTELYEYHKGKEHAYFNVIDLLNRIKDKIKNKEPIKI